MNSDTTTAEIVNPVPPINMTDDMPMFPVNNLLAGNDFGGIPGNISFADLDPYTYQWFDIPENMFSNMDYNSI